jgi:two-component system NtrC family response regulator/two-component system response regulator HydG/two-component system response regulator AtoC
MKKSKILLVDDNETILKLFVSLPEADHYNIVPRTSAEKAFEYLSEESVDLIVSDVQMPGLTGTELFLKVQDTYPDIPFILITAFGSTEDAVMAVKQGAFHYFKKPIDDKLDLLWSTIREALSKRNMLREVASLKKEKDLKYRIRSPIIGRSPGIKNILQLIKEAAEYPVNVLIYGETGTGKELVAESIHDMSDRRDKPFFAITCTELSHGVIESELFGHVKGAFTGAINQKKGVFEVAHEGTLFLDEIGVTPDYLQSKLLRVLETKSFKPVGGSTTQTSDFRIISATNRNLEKEVSAGNFRQDLFYRLNVFTIEIPPLRERREDIPLIAEYYLNLFARRYRKEIEGISESAFMALRSYSWPGNVRELVNVMERAVITCKNAIITTKHLPFKTDTDDAFITSDINLKEIERFYIELALKRTDFNKTRAAGILGISRNTLIQKTKKYETEVL